MIDWGVRTNRTARRPTELGWHTGGLRETKNWADVQGVAVVHVEGDHFILYDADNGIFYDPG